MKRIILCKIFKHCRRQHRDVFLLKLFKETIKFKPMAPTNARFQKLTYIASMFLFISIILFKCISVLNVFLAHKLTFLPSSYTHVRVRISGEEMLLGT